MKIELRKVSVEDVKLSLNPYSNGMKIELIKTNAAGEKEVS